MKEFEFIEIIKKTLSDSSFIGDDTAFWEGLAITQDTLIEDIHFRRSTISAYDLGQKAIAVNFSDLAAAGAEPKCVLVSLSLSKEVDSNFVKEFYEGINLVCKAHNAVVVGGDITGSDSIAITVTAIGKAEKQIKRSSAQVGDIVFVTGEHGNSRAGLEILERNLPRKEKFLKAHNTPVPKIKEGLAISHNCENPALMDTSDGLADALYKIATASNVSIEVDFDKVPQDDKIQNKYWVLFGGEDYELLGTARPDDFEKLKSQIELYPIGKVVSRSVVPVTIQKDQKTLKLDKQTFESLSFDHFGGRKQ